MVLPELLRNRLLTKWFEIGAFQPIDRDHTEKGTGDQEPWVGGPTQEDIRRRFIETRYELMPYLYTLAEEASRTGLPLVRPLFLEFPDAAPDLHPIDLDLTASGEFMLGSDLLVAPPPFPDELDEYSVEFPTALWYDFWSGAKVDIPPPDPPASGAPDRTPLFATRVSPKLAELPVYVRAGSILPIEPLTQSTNETPTGPLTLRVYPGDNCSGELYQDDGKSYAYRKGIYLRERFTCAAGPAGFRLNIGPRQGSYPPWWSEVRVEIYGWRPTKNHLLLNGTAVPWKIESDTHMIAFTFTDPGTSAAIELE